MKKVTSTEVVAWAEDFLVQAENELRRDEVKEQKKYASLIQNPQSKTLLSKMLDESSQIRVSSILSFRIKKLIDQYGVPDFFTPFEQFQLRLFSLFGYIAYPIAIPIFKSKLRSETSKIIIAEERPTLTKHLKSRKEDRIGQNVNLLGEVVLGDQEANNRFHHYLTALEQEDINYISIKLSGIYAQIRPLSYDTVKSDLCELVASIFRKAMKHTFIDANGVEQSKFVNLDMEEYKETELTLDVFISVLSREEFKNLYAGIVIQAYLPDALLYYRRLAEFAKARFTDGGSPIKIRLVKGANLQMETIISDSKGWRNPVLPTKISVDANYLRILDDALLPENAQAIHIGVASHNLVSLGYAYLLSEGNNVSDCVTFEMLEGMANHLPRVFRSLEKEIILYTPVVRRESFLNAISYLVRRLDENTGVDNFLSYSFQLKVNSDAWKFLVNQFEAALALKDDIEPEVFRQQNRTKIGEYIKSEDFNNEPDTDFYLSQNRDWALKSLAKWKNVRKVSFKVPVQIGSQTLETPYKREYFDRSTGGPEAVCEASLSNKDHIVSIIEEAIKDSSSWSKRSLHEIGEILGRVATNLSNRRGDLIGCMAAITGKPFMEGDVEVSEAIDFCRFYPHSMKEFSALESVSYKPKGVVLVISPWNFPLAIPIGGVAAALSGGNRVILKPATNALPVAWLFAQAFWDAGVPKDTLQIACPKDYKTLDVLTTHKSIKHIILTGGTDTVVDLIQKAPTTPISAELGGKNCIIVTASADQDHAIQSIVQSAFGNSGQKCSACSLLLLDKRTFNSKQFKEKLKDAVNSLPVGSIWDSETLIGPMITNKNEKLKRAIEVLEEGESWLVSPKYIDEQEYILKPCVKWNIKPESYTFKTELFAPLLAVVCIDSLKKGVQIANSSEYGLTSGLQSLDEREIKYWTDHIEAGNLYVNRGITGAIVNRQPFGGMKRSAFGGGIKAGGPNYVSSFVRFIENSEWVIPDSQSPLAIYTDSQSEKDRLNYAYCSYTNAWDTVFSKCEDWNKIEGEHNLFRYLPLKSFCLRIRDSDKLIDILLILQAILITGQKTSISISDTDSKLNLIEQIVKTLNIKAEVLKESKFDFSLFYSKFERIRFCSSDSIKYHGNDKRRVETHFVIDSPVIEGRIELLNYLQEQSISHEYHRYGSVFDKEDL